MGKDGDMHNEDIQERLARSKIERLMKASPEIQKIFRGGDECV